MSSMLEQAIVDAKALKEAALKNAEQAVIDKYNKQKKPMDKEKFQAKVAKSHRDLLMGLKENLDEKKKKDKIKIGEESTLDRMNKKLQEKKNG